jgi:two-component system, chemotaxis family, protein-glutamate methylesterase/glutaminase
VPNIVVIGASAGGLGPLREIVKALPGDLKAAIFVVMHLSPLAPSFLSSILGAGAEMEVLAAVDGQRIQPSTIYVARPDRHLLIEPGYIRLTRGPKENRHRPAIDPLFRTAARVYGPRVMGIVLTGLMGDGTTGLQVIKAEGGVAIVQDPKDAQFPSMPESAMRSVRLDFVLPASEIAGKIRELAKESWKDIEPARAKEVSRDPPSPEGEKMRENQDERLVGEPSMFTCPDCNGTLWKHEDEGVMRFRCRVGHAYSSDGMRAGYSESVEGALWSAVRALEESAALEETLADRARERGDKLSAASFREIAKSRNEQAEVIRTMLLSKNNPDEIIVP